MIPPLPPSPPRRSSPVLTNGGFPVVDGVITAFDRYSSVRLAGIGLPLLERAQESSPLDARCLFFGHEQEAQEEDAAPGQGSP